MSTPKLPRTYDPKSLSIWLVRMLPQGMVHVLVSWEERGERDTLSSEPCKDISWKADEYAESVFTLMGEHAKSVGGSPRYTVRALNDRSGEIASTTIPLHTQTDPVNPPPAGSSPSDSAAAKSFNAVSAAYEKLCNQILKVNEQLATHNLKMGEQNLAMADKMMADKKVVEESLSQAHERAMKEMETKATNERMDRGFDALMDMAKKFAPGIIAKKTGLPLKFVEAATGGDSTESKKKPATEKVSSSEESKEESKPANENAPKVDPFAASKGKRTIGGSLAQLDDATLKSLIDRLPQEEMIAWLGEQTEENQVRIGELFKALNQQADKEEKEESQGKAD